MQNSDLIYHSTMRLSCSRRSALGLLAASAASPVIGRSKRIEKPRDVVLPTLDGRACSVAVWRAKQRRGTILFSHGALSAPIKYSALIEPWVDAGFDVWAPLHVDSTDHPETAKYPGLASWPARIHDMRAVGKHVGPIRYVAAGHSYGGLIALSLGGALPSHPAGVIGPLADPNVDSVIAFSPPGPGMGLIDAPGYAMLSVPALIETGTADVPPGAASRDGWHDHLVAYEAGNGRGDRYAIVLDRADHYFGGLICRPELAGPKQNAQLELAIVRSLTFLRGYGLWDRRARQQLVWLARTTLVSGPGLYRR